MANTAKQFERWSRYATQRHVFPLSHLATGTSGTGGLQSLIGTKTALNALSLPYAIYDGQPKALPWPMSVWIGINSAAGTTSVTATVEGIDQFGNKIPAQTISGITGAAGVMTGFQTPKAYAFVTKVYLTAITNGAAGDVLNCGISMGSGAALATLPRPRLALPVQKRFISAAHWTLSFGGVVTSPVTIDSENTFVTQSATTGDGTAANCAFAWLSCAYPEKVE